MSFGFKFVDIIIPKDDNRPFLKTNLSLRFYYKKSDGLVSRFFDEISGEEMTSVMNTRNFKMKYDSVYNKLINFYFSSVGTVQTEAIMQNVFGYLPSGNSSCGVTFIGFYENVYIACEPLVEFKSTYKIYITDYGIIGPKYINITLEKQLFPDPNTYIKQDLLNTQICLQFFYYLNNGNLTDLKWYNPVTKKYEDIWHLVSKNPTPVFDESDPNNPLSIVYLSAKPNDNPILDSNIQLMKKIFGYIHSNYNSPSKPDKPVGYVNFISNLNSINFYAIDNNGQVIDYDDYQVIFAADIPITDIGCEPKYINITLTTQKSPDIPPILEQNLLKTSICMQFFYSRITGELSDLKWYNPDSKDYEDIWHLVLKDRISIPVFNQSDHTLRNVYLSSKSDNNQATQPNIELMRKIFGTLRYYYNNNGEPFPDEPVGLVNINSNEKILDFDALNTEGYTLDGYTVVFNATIPISDTDSCCFSEGTKILSLSNQKPIDGYLTSH
jgi:hypothetical protein